VSLGCREREAGADCGRVIRRTPTLLLVALACGCPRVESTPASTPTETKVAASEPSPAQPAAVEPDADERGKLQGVTAAHNAVRKRVGVAPLRWSRQLARYAQTWADRLAARGCDLQHRRSSQYGENLFWSSHPVDADAVVAEWSAEAVDYVHRNNSCKSTCGHYTQVVWSGSRSLGCGMAKCGESELWVCNYDPPGNMVGRKPY
jgi:pathogenesis-related protein 1